MAKEGHIIGNHSENHPSFAEIPIDEIETEINVLNKKIKELTGTDVKYIRPPKGEYSEQVMGKLYNMGYKTVFWSFAYLDWDVTIQRGGDYAYNQIMPYLDEGMVLLLHAVSGDNADCLEKFIKDARAKGYEFAAIDEL
jgi:peptidoglycan-N-acetylmuramic acid deacetylase